MVEMLSREYDDWDDYFLDLAQLVSKKSKDPSTKIGVVVVGPNNEIRSTGFNGFPRGVQDKQVSKPNSAGMDPATVNKMIADRYERPLKYTYTEHAERNAIFHAARNGNSMEGCTMYINSYPIPCSDCTRAAIQAGITTIIGIEHNKPVGNHWSADAVHAKTMLDEAGINLIVIPASTRNSAFNED